MTKKSSKKGVSTKSKKKAAFEEVKKRVRAAISEFENDLIDVQQMAAVTAHMVSESRHGLSRSPDADSEKVDDGALWMVTNLCKRSENLHARFYDCFRKIAAS